MTTPSECEACGAGSSVSDKLTLSLHGPNCIREYTKDGSCQCSVIDVPSNETSIPTKTVNLTMLNFHGRKLWLCEDCYAKEQQILNKGEMNLHEYQKNVPDRIEQKVESIVKQQTTVAKWQDLYSSERPNWVLSNFQSVDELREKLVEFIASMEVLEWEIKTKKRAAYDSAKELDTRLSKEQREALINDPNFKVPTNSEFKKIQKERELDELIKGMGANHLTAKQRKAVESLVAFGLTPDEIKAQLKIT